MTNTVLLREKIDASGYKLSFLAKKCGITYQAFLSRMKNEVEFRVNEVRVLKELLNLSDEDVAKIFYSKT